MDDFSNFIIIIIIIIIIINYYYYYYYYSLDNSLFFRQKSDTTIAFKKFLAEVTSLGLVKRVRSDNGEGGGVTSYEFKNVLIDNFILHEKSSPHSPHRNGTAERHWRTLF